MARLTIKRVDEMAAGHGCRFYKGAGYFYFVPKIELCIVFYEENVMVPRLTDLTLGEWEQELKRKIAGGVRI